MSTLIRSRLTVASVSAVVLLAAVLSAPLLVQAATAPAVPADKQSRIDAMNADMSRSRQLTVANPKAADPGKPASVDTSGTSRYLDPHFAVGSGTVVMNTDPIPGDSTTLVANMWVQPKPFTIVYAGRDASDPTIGVVVISQSASGILQRFTLRGHGGLRIVGGSDVTLALTADDGSSVSLDVATGALR